MAKQINFRGQHQKELAKILREVAERHTLWQVFSDFLAMAALSISNSMDKRQFDQREAEYMQIVGRYSKAEANLIAHGLAHVVMGLEEGPQDFLGSLFMSLELGNAWAGQFFTPYEVSLMMAKMQLDGDEPKRIISNRGFITVNDPCTGGGAMLIAAAHALLDEGLNPFQHMHATAQDIDIKAVHMTYIQLSLLGVPAAVVHGNSLAVEQRSVWYTPAHFLGFWDNKLRRAGLADAARAPKPAALPAAAALFIPSADAQAFNGEMPKRRASQLDLF